MTGGANLITSKPTKKMCEEWKNIWIQYQERLKPNHKTGTELLHYIQDKYILTEI